MPIALVSAIHDNDRALGALHVNPVAVGVSDDGLAQFAILTGASVWLMRVLWNGR